MTKLARVGIWLAVALISSYLLVSFGMGVVLANLALHPARRLITQRSAFGAILLDQFQAPLNDVSITGSDGAVLRAWYAQPASWSGSAVILLHGMADNREGVSGYARMFLHRGYAVLLPDSRGHGESGGMATYGVAERDDVRRRAEWLGPHVTKCEYLFGESMGAAIALQASQVIPDLCAVASEAPFSSFREIGLDRISQTTHLSERFIHTAGLPALEFGLLYASMRYGVNLWEADPSKAIRTSHTPTLLIGDSEDSNIPVRHSFVLEREGKSHTTLWLVRGAQHTGAVGVDPPEFEHRVVGWFLGHTAP